MSQPTERSRVKAELASKQGNELVSAIADEFGDLHAQMRRIEDRLRLLPIYRDFSERLSLLAESGLAHEELPDRLKIEASHLLAADGGFYAIEYDRSGRAYRWTGPRRHFYFVLYLDRRAPLRIELELCRLADSGMQKNLLLLADGKPVALHAEFVKSDIVASATLPPLASARATSLIFVLPALVPETDGVNVRHIGVAFRELRVYPAESVAATEQRAFGSRKPETRETLNWLMAPDNSQGPGAPGGPSPALLGDKKSAGRRRDRDYGSLHEGGERSFPRSVRIDAEGVEDGTAGFYPLETDPSGHSYRWTGPARTFGFAVRVDRSRPLMVELCFVRFVNRESQTPVRMQIGDLDRELKLRNGPEGIVGRAMIPAGDLISPTRLTFAVQSVVRPGNADRRSLGLAFRYLALEPASQSRARDLLWRIRHSMKAFARRVLQTAGRSAPVRRGEE